jgi:hypothetical protein
MREQRTAGRARREEFPGELFDKLGCLEDACAPFEAAAVPAGNGREHGLLRRRAMDAADAAMSSS